MIKLVSLAAALTLAFVGTAPAASKIEPIVSPGGIKAWLVREQAVPMVAIDYAFLGGANADPADKPGVASMVGALLDEGAGELDARAFHERMEEKAIQLGFTAGRDHFRGSLRSLTANLDSAVELLRLALASPRFDAEPVEVVRNQMLANLSRATTNPNEIANRRWWATAFPGHPYGRPSNGTPESVAAITPDDLKAYVRNVFARDTLTIGIVGDIEPKAAGELIDRAFGGLPAKATLAPVPNTAMQELGERDRGQSRRAADRDQLRRARHRPARSGLLHRLCGEPHLRGRLAHFAALSRGAREAGARLWNPLQPDLDGACAIS